MEIKYGWICPLCGKVLSPDTKACDCYKQDKKEEILKKASEPIDPIKLEDLLKDFKWVKDWQTPYDDQPKFRFYTSGSSNPCDGCPNKGKGFCNCTLCSKVTY